MAGAYPLGAFNKEQLLHLTILHTNDTHSRIEPFPMDGSRYEGLGGVEPRSRLIDKIRKEVDQVLLVDGGDIFQGTPYFNLFDGELELRLMSKLGYEAGVPGNHDFDKGIDNLATQLENHAKFPLIVSNYDLSNTPLNDIVRPRYTVQKGDIKIGIVGAGIVLDGLVTPMMYGDIQFLDTVETVDRQAEILRNEEKCNLVVCLSHLGYAYKSGKMSDVVLARESRHIDIIIGGHTHTFLDEPTIIKNKADKPVFVNQAGWGGIQLGRLDITLERNKKEVCVNCENYWVKS